MRTRKALYALAVLLAGTALAPAFDAGVAPSVAPDPAPRPSTTSTADMRAALAAYRAGDKADAARIFAAAAERGHVPAQWKLARMLAAGDGIAQDTVRAAAIYRAIADLYIDRDPAIALVPFVAHAMREAGRLVLAGQAGPRDIRTARRHLYRAATDYRDARARYHLAVSLMDPAHGRPQPRTAAHWLRGAVALGHARAGALLGEMRIAGIGMKADPVEGLLTMARAVERAADTDRPTLALRFQSARAAVDEAARLGTDAELARLGLEAAMEPIMQAVAE